MFPSPSMRRRWLTLIAVALSVLVVDQVSKWIIINNLVPYESIPVLPPFLHITYSANTGAAFGFLPDAGIVFLILAVVIVGVMLFVYPRINSQVTRVAMGLVVGGAIGNAVDRLQHGYVVDFVHITIPNIISNVSNFADHAIVVGVITFAIQNWREEQQEKANRAAAEHEEENATLPVATLYGDEESPKQ